jgi:hypothetical protein
MLLGGAPYMSIAPCTKFPQLLHFGVVMLHIVFYRQPAGIEDAHVCAEPVEDP